MTIGRIHAKDNPDTRYNIMTKGRIHTRSNPDTRYSIISIGIIHSRNSRSTFTKRSRLMKQKQLPVDVERCFENVFFNGTLGIELSNPSGTHKDFQATRIGKYMEVKHAINSNFKVPMGSFTLVKSNCVVGQQRAFLF